MEHFVEQLIHLTIEVLELIGVIVIIVSGVKAFYKYVKGFFSFKDLNIKIDLAKGLALALEFKLGAEILKTVVIRTLDEMLILASVVLLRVLLTFVIHWEIKSEAHHSDS